MKAEQPALQNGGYWLEKLVNGFGGLLRPLKIRGKGRVGDFAGRRIAPLCPEVTLRVARGFELRVPLADRIGRLMWVGAYEPELRMLLTAFLQPGMVFLDVGAHFGYFSVLAAAQVGAEGEVYAFEANPACVERLSRNVHPYPQIRLYGQAVSDTDGEVVFFPSLRPEESGWGSLWEDAERAPSISVLAIRLDTWLRTSGATRVDFLKLDIEGAEYRALLGASQLLRQMRPVLFSEVNEVCLARDGRLPQDLFSLLASFGYLVRGVLDRRSGALASALAVPAEKSALWRQFERLPLPLVAG